MVRLAHLCTQTIPAPIALKIYKEAHFIASFLIIQAELVFSCSAKKYDYFTFCLKTFVKHAQFHISCIATPQQCTWTFVTY
jgi:hypothetical protein